MTDEEIKAAIAEAVATAQAELEAKHKADIQGLKSKNAELIADKKKLAEAADEIESAAAEASGDWEVKYNAAQKALDKVSKERDEAFHTRDSLLIDNQIASDLVAMNVAKPFHSMLTRALKAQAKVDGDKGMIEGQPITDYMKDFLSTDEGKNYVAAPDTSGGGASSTTKVASTTWATPPVSGGEIEAFFKEDKDVTNSLAQQWNRPDLQRS